jgi:hypothetical protein
VCPAVERALQDESHPDPGANGDEREGREVAAVAMVTLGDGGGVDVVLDCRLGAEEATKVAQDRRPLPAGEVGSKVQCAAVGFDDSRAADDRLKQCAVSGDARVLQQLVRECGELADPPHSARRACGLALPDADCTRKICDGAADELTAYVEPQDETRVATNLVQRRASSATADPSAGVLHERVALEARQGEGDGRLREAGGAHEIAARHRPVPSHPLEQELLVERADQSRPSGAGGSGRHHYLVPSIKIG